MPLAPGLRLFDTLTGEPQPVPLSEADGAPLLKLYVCGITPYDSGHLGHGFTYCAFDVLVRYLEMSGVRVRYVQNVTDVDTPLFERAERDGVDWQDLARREEASFRAEMARLGWREPDVFPRASEEIDTIVRAVGRVEEAGLAYREDATYFAATRYPGWGQLSKLTREQMISKLDDEQLLGRVGPGAKHDAVDFALWLPSGPAEAAWPSPWGEGRPGWHIECSAMSMQYLGEQLDVHGGGRDLIFSHHESERAQSETLTGVAPFARLWMHTGLVHCDEEKMSKSLGNLVLIREALEEASPAGLRLYLASNHYRQDWQFHRAALDRGEELASRARAVGLETAPPVPLDALRGDRLGSAFLQALDQDLDTPRAVDLFSEAVDGDNLPLARTMLNVLAGTASLERG